MPYQPNRHSVYEDRAVKEFAWADLKRTPKERRDNVELDGLRLHASQADGDPLQFILENSKMLGFIEVFQVRIGHRPDAPSRFRLAKGVFPLCNDRQLALTEEVLFADGRSVLVGAQRLDGQGAAVSCEGCRDQAVCCFVLANSPLALETLISAIKDSVVVNGVCSINYPDLVGAMGELNHVVAKIHPSNREDVVLLGSPSSVIAIESSIEALGR